MTRETRFDGAKLRNTWRQLLATAGKIPIVVFLPPWTNAAVLNKNLRDVHDVIREVAAQSGVCVVDLNPKLAPAGTLKPEFTSDGVHLTEEAYHIWAAEIVSTKQGCPK